MTATMKRRLIDPIRSVVREAIVIMRSPMAQAIAQDLTTERCTDCAQWRRWYKANRKYQRQMAALKRIPPGRKIDPRIASLPRWVVR